MTERPKIHYEAGRFEVIFHASPPAYYPEEAHDTVQVCIPFEGARYAVERSSATGSKLTHDLGPKAILVVPQGQPHAIAWKQQADILSLHLSTEFLEAATGRADFDIADALVVRDPLISSLAGEVRTAIAERAETPILLSAFATVIGFKIARAASNRRPQGSDMARPLSANQMARIDQYISLHLDDNIRLEGLAALTGLTHWHFLRRFQATQGMSPHAYVIDRRMKHACAMLLETSISITEIALEVGMSHSHFSRTFQRNFGLSPIGFRDRHRS